MTITLQRGTKMKWKTCNTVEPNTIVTYFDHCGNEIEVTAEQLEQSRCALLGVTDPVSLCGETSQLKTGVTDNQFERHSVTTLLPAQLAGTTDVFVQFLKKYYEYMSLECNPTRLIENSVEMRDVFSATDEFLDLLFHEYGFSWLENKATHRANIIAHLDDIYKTKGTINSIKVLFRCMAGEEVEVVLPRDYVLKPSDGEWKQNFIVTAQLEYGDPFSLIGELVPVSTFIPDEPEQTFEVEVLNVQLRSNNVYHLEISKHYSGFFFWESVIETCDKTVSMKVLPSLGDNYQIVDGGKNFRLGDIYEVKHYRKNKSYDVFQSALTDNQLLLDYFDLTNDPTAVVDFTLAETIAQNVLQYTEYLYKPFEFNRWVLVDAKLNRYAEERVVRYHYTDGQKYEEIRRTNDIFIYKASRGVDTITQTIHVNGDYTLELTQEKEYYPALDIVVNWDEIIISMFKSLLGQYNRYEHIFRATNPETGFMYGDINQDGVIDETDLVYLVRASMGVSLTIETQADDQNIIRESLFEIGREVLSRGIEPLFEYYDDSSTTIKVIDVEGEGLSSLQNVDTVNVGYNFPKVGFTSLIPKVNSFEYNRYVNTDYWLKDTFYTDDFLGKNKGILAYGSAPVTRGSYFWNSSKGFLDTIIKLHDGFYYQDFSYVVRSEQSPLEALSWLSETVHPSGFKAFAEQLLRENLVVEQDAPHHTVTQSLITRLDLVIRPIFKPGYEQEGYSEEDLVDLVNSFQSEREAGMFDPTGFAQANNPYGFVPAYGNLAEDLIGFVDYGEITVNFAPYKLTGYTVDDDYTTDEKGRMPFA